MKHWPWLLAGGAILAGGGLFAGTQVFGFATVRGTLSEGNRRAPIKPSRVVLLQGPSVQLLMAMDVIQPGFDLEFKDGSTSTWTTTDSEGRFQFTDVRAAKSAITALAELSDGRICATTSADIEAGFGTYDVELQVKPRPCWTRTIPDPAQ